MVLTQELKGLIRARGLTQEIVAEKLELSSKTFNSRLKNGKFRTDEIEKLIEILEIKDPIAIFFAKK